MRARDFCSAKRVRMPRSEKMANRRRDGVSDVGFSGRTCSCHEPGGHRPDLFFLGSAVSGDRFLDRGGAIFEDTKSGNPQNRQYDPARVGELKRGSGADSQERRLNRGFGGGMFLNYGRQPFVQPGETVRQVHPLGETQLSAGDELGLVDRSGYDGPSRASGPRVNPQDPPRLRQDASSETASSSKDRLA